MTSEEQDVEDRELLDLSVRGSKAARLALARLRAERDAAVKALKILEQRFGLDQWDNEFWASEREGIYDAARAALAAAERIDDTLIIDYDKTARILPSKR